MVQLWLKATYLWIAAFARRKAIRWAKIADCARAKADRIKLVLPIIIVLAAQEIARSTAIVGLISLVAAPVVVVRSAWSAAP